MDIAQALAYASANRNGVLATMKRDGRPQLSNISHGVGADGVIRISITADRAKYANIVRDSRASLHVTQTDFWGYVVIEGDAVVAPPAATIDDATTEALVDLYRSLAGEHPNWDEYRSVMVADRRTVVSLTPTHAYGMLPQK
jgi:PPOX class probable F420-dependent enzyme